MANILDKTLDQQFKFSTKNWVEISNEWKELLDSNPEPLSS